MSGRGDATPACVGSPGDATVTPTHSFPGTLPSLRPHHITSQVVRGLSAGTRVFEYMTLSPCIPLSGGCWVPREQLRGSITFHNVSFRSVSVGGPRGGSLGAGDLCAPLGYRETSGGTGATRDWEPDLTEGLSAPPSYPCRPGFQVLKDFTLTLPPGRIVALVGQSGGGKRSPQPRTP